MNTLETVLITGANAGLGKDAARQLALSDDVQKIYLACRSEEKALAAKAELEAATGKQIFEIVLLDTSSLDSARAAAGAISEPLHGVILNAGGPGGDAAGDLTEDGVVQSFAVNVLGHAALIDTLLAANKIQGTVAFVSSEAVRGIPAMGMARADLKTGSVEEFVQIANGKSLTKFDPMVAYGPIKYLGTQWINAMARRHPHVRFLSVSPGATTGTNATEQLSGFQRFLFTRVAFPLLTLFGRAHGLETGAARYIEVLRNPKYATGRFYASPWPSTSGELVDQGEIWDVLLDEVYQEHAYEALRQFLPEPPAVTKRATLEALPA